MSFLANVAGAIMTGLQAGIVAYKEQAGVPQKEYGWDTFDARLSRYWLYDSYDNNTVYRAINSQSLQHKQDSRLYKHIDGIYNPVSRLVSLLTAYVYGGGIDYEHMTAGAIPIVSDNEALLDAIRHIFQWSHWGQNKSLYVRNGTVLGDSPLWVVDDRERGKVRLETVHPSRIRQAQFDEVGNVKSAVIQYRRCDEEELAIQKPSTFGFLGSKPIEYYEFTLTATKERFTTYKDGEEYAFYKDANGRPVSSWENDYGFVPLVMAAHKPTNESFAANAFYNCVGKIDRINDVASLLNNQIRNIIIPILYAAGASNSTPNKKIEAGMDEKDTLTILYGPENSTLAPVTVPIDITGALENIKQMLLELEYDLPILALQRVREQSGTMTAPGVKTGYSDAIGLVTEAMGQYDQSLVKALQMAISIGGYNAYAGFESFGLDSYDAGDLDFWIKERPVIADELGRSEKITFLSQVNSMSPALQKLALTEMDYPDDDIQEVVTYTLMKEQASQQRADMIAGQGNNQQPNTPQLPPGQQRQTQPQLPAEEQPGRGQPGANNNHPTANAQRMGEVMQTWKTLGIAPSLMRAKAG